MSLQTNIRILLTLGFLVALSACGPANTKAQSSDLGSTGTTTTTTSTTSNKVIATCNRASSSSTSYKIAAQMSGSTFDPSWANLTFTSIPSSFQSGTIMYQFFKGQATSDSTLTYNSSAVPFYIYDTVTGAYLSETPYTSLKWSDVKSLISGVSSASTFLSRVIFLLSLNDSAGAYQTLSLRSYTISSGATVDIAEMLLPTFYANPSDYAYTSTGAVRESVLQNLHPLRGQTGDYATLATSLCQ
jgi:hypothetical protein